MYPALYGVFFYRVLKLALISVGSNTSQGQLFLLISDVFHIFSIIFNLVCGRLVSNSRRSSNVGSKHWGLSFCKVSSLYLPLILLFPQATHRFTLLLFFKALESYLIWCFFLYACTVLMCLFTLVNMFNIL